MPSLDNKMRVKVESDRLLPPFSSSGSMGIGFSLPYVSLNSHLPYPLILHRTHRLYYPGDSHPCHVINDTG